jgi:TolB protein
MGKKWYSALPLLLGALMVAGGFLWYTGRIALNFEVFSTYANPMLGISFRYPSSWKPDIAYGTVGDVSGRYEGSSGFFGIDAIASESNIADLTNTVANHKLQPYGKNPVILPLKAGRQEARVIIPSKDQIGPKREVALVVPYPQPVTVNSRQYNYLLIVGDPGHIKAIADTLEFNEYNY